MYNLVGS